MLPLDLLSYLKNGWWSFLWTTRFSNLGINYSSSTQHGKWRIIKLWFQPVGFLNLLIHKVPTTSVSPCSVCSMSELCLSYVAQLCVFWGYTFLSVDPCLFFSRTAAGLNNCFSTNTSVSKEVSCDADQDNDWDWIPQKFQRAVFPITIDPVG